LERDLRTWWSKLDYGGLLISQPKMPGYVHAAKTFAASVQCDVSEEANLLWIEKREGAIDLPEVKNDVPWKEISDEPDDRIEEVREENP